MSLLILVVPLEVYRVPPAAYLAAFSLKLMPLARDPSWHSAVHHHSMMPAQQALLDSDLTTSIALTTEAL